jgi:hypothetical protein
MCSVDVRFGFSDGGFGGASDGGDEGGVEVEDVDDPFGGIPVTESQSACSWKGSREHSRRVWAISEVLPMRQMKLVM